jgi:excinuclease ABC subunit B
MYADHITASMQRTIDSTNKRRIKQTEYNTLHGITPQALQKAASSLSEQLRGKNKSKSYDTDIESTIAAEPVMQYMTTDQLKRTLEKIKKDMQKAAKDLNFIEAARLRDEMYAVQAKLQEKERK